MPEIYVSTDIEADGAPSPHERLSAADIRRWQSGIANTVPGPGPQMPAGDPIGGSSRVSTSRPFAGSISMATCG